MTFELRDLELADYGRGILDLLQQLTVVGQVSEELFAERFAQIQASPDYKVVVIEDVEKGRVIASATLLVERKFIHACGKVGHIEDVVVDSSYRGHHLGQRVIEALTTAAREMGCYKVILDCAESNAAFYKKCGLARKEIQMVMYF